MARRDSRTHAERQLIAAAISEMGCCEHCGSDSHLQGHHRIPKSVNPALTLERSNIVVLCADCHALEHPDIGGFIARPRRRKGKIINCETCGAEKYVKPSHIGLIKHCCRACRFTGEARQCEICGNRFYVPRERLNRGEGRFCSLTCFGKSNGRHSAAMRWRDHPPRDVVCQTCNTPFQVNHSRPARFCSLRCFGIFNIASRAKSAFECREIPFS